MIRTRNLWDCILAHAVTNGDPRGYVIVAGQWQYWLYAAMGLLLIAASARFTAVP